MNNSPLLSVEKLTHKHEDGGIGIKEVSFTVSAGEFILLTGENGSGKTMLIRHLNGLLEAQEGGVFYRGRPVKEQLPEVRRKIGIVFQTPEAQFIGQTVLEDIAFGPENLGWDSEKIGRVCAEVLGAFRLGELADRSPRTLSGGEKRLLAAAAVYAMQPEMLILDEPFSNLDFAGVTAVLEVISDVRRKGTALLLACHDYEKVLGLADRVLILQEGRLCIDAGPEAALGHLSSYGLTPPEYYAAGGSGIPGADFFSWTK